MFQRPLVFVAALTLGDYLLWNWSLNSNRAVIALISGLTLLPLAVSAVWMFAVASARQLAEVGRRRRLRRSAAAKQQPSALAEDAAAAAQTASSRKLAA